MNNTRKTVHVLSVSEMQELECISLELKSIGIPVTISDFTKAMNGLSGDKVFVMPAKNTERLIGEAANYEQSN